MEFNWPAVKLRVALSICVIDFLCRSIDEPLAV